MEKVDHLEQWRHFIKGSQGAFEQLYVQHAKMLYRYGLHLTTNRELLEDVIHDLFVYLHERRTRLPEQVESVSAYLLVSFRHRLLRSLKEESPTFIIDHVPEEKLIADRRASSELMDRESRDEKKQLIAYINTQLTDRQKQIIYLRYREQLTFREIALVMDISYQSAKNLMQKTLQKLKEKVGNR